MPSSHPLPPSCQWFSAPAAAPDPRSAPRLAWLFVGVPATDSPRNPRIRSAVALLLETGDKECEKTVLAWEELNPHENETNSYLEINGRKLGPFYSFGELSLKNRASWIKYEKDLLHGNDY